MPVPYYPQITITPNLGLSLIGMDEVIALDMVLIDTAFGTVSGHPGGTTGQVQYNNGGVFGGIAEGTAGQVLTSNGAGVAPSFQAGGGGGAFVKLNPTADQTITGPYKLTLSDVGSTFVADGTAVFGLPFDAPGITPIPAGDGIDTVQIWNDSGDADNTWGLVIVAKSTSLGQSGAFAPQVLADASTKNINGVDCVSVYTTSTGPFNVNQMAGLSVSVDIEHTGTTNFAIGLSVEGIGKNTSSSVNTIIGLQIGSMTGATNTWALLTNAGLVEFGDNVKIDSNKSFTMLGTAPDPVGTIMLGSQVGTAGFNAYMDLEVEMAAGHDVAGKASYIYFDGTQTGHTTGSFYGAQLNTGAQAVDIITAIRGYVENDETTLVTPFMASLFALGGFAAGANTTNQAGLYVEWQRILGSLATNTYGIYIEDQGVGSTDYASYTVGGKVFIGKSDLNGLQLGGSSSGLVTIQAAAVAGSSNPLVLPTTTGTSGQVLSTDGANPQQLSWITVSSTPSEVASVHLTAQTASIGTTTLYAVPASGVYRVSYYVKITTAGSTSGSVTLTLSYTDRDDSVAITTVVPTPANATDSTSVVSGTLIVDAKTGTNITYATTYASVGGTAMVYKTSLKVETV